RLTIRRSRIVLYESGCLEPSAHTSMTLSPRSSKTERSERSPAIAPARARGCSMPWLSALAPLAPWRCFLELYEKPPQTPYKPDFFQYLYPQASFTACGEEEIFWVPSAPRQGARRQGGLLPPFKNR